MINLIFAFSQSTRSKDVHSKIRTAVSEAASMRDPKTGKYPEFRRTINIQNPGLLNIGLSPDQVRDIAMRAIDGQGTIELTPVDDRGALVYDPDFTDFTIRAEETLVLHIR